MIERAYQLTQGEEKTVERLITDENLHYAHIILPPGDSMPQHTSNAPVYLTVLRGALTLRLGEQAATVYRRGTLLAIPQGIEMDIRNQNEAALNFIIVKAPPPGK